MSLSNVTIPLQFICERVMRNDVLDVFYIIAAAGEIHKKGVAEKFKEHLGLEKESQKFRHQISEAIAMLEGATFIDFYKSQTEHLYYLTEFGKLASDWVTKAINEQPNILIGSKVVRKLFEQNKGEKL